MADKASRFALGGAALAGALGVAPASLAEEKALAGHTDYVFAVAFSHYGKRLASASADGTLRLWDVGAGKLLQTIKAHEGSVYDVALSPDGTTLATAGGDNLVR